SNTTPDAYTLSLHDALPISNAQRLMKDGDSSLPERDLARAVINVLMLKLRCELGSEVVHFHNDRANAGYEKVVTEHRWNRHAERSEEHTSELQSPCNLVCRL